MDQQPSDAEINGWTLVGLGSMLVGCVVAGLVLGWLADDLAGTAPVGVLVGLSIGVVAGVVGSFVRILSYLRR